VSALAAATERVEIGTLVLCSSFRHPPTVAKMAATADEVSGGRLILGLGAGWHDAEYDPFAKDHRVDRFEEALGIVVPLLRGQTVTFDGEYFTTRDAVLEPPPSRHIPVLVAALGPRMLRLTARHASAWNTAWFGEPDERLRGQMEALDEGLAAEGRDLATLERTVGIEIRDPSLGAAEQAGEEDGEDRAFGGSVDGLAEAIAAYDELGIGHLIAVLQLMTEASLERLALAFARR
jgi:alkanesulfonate monooxygenase SsuD/methylene tetrahydromethanopterin reductase-like flavin-dependent oxidoreductase (luciferase family)